MVRLYTRGGIGPERTAGLEDGLRSSQSILSGHGVFPKARHVLGSEEVLWVPPLPPTGVEQ